MEQKEKSAQELKALEQVKKAQANLAKVRREEKAKARKEQDHQKVWIDEESGTDEVGWARCNSHPFR